MNPLPTPLRRLLEKAILEARKVAEGGARKALEALAVHQPDPYPHMDASQRNHRRKLRAQARQLGDGESLIRRGAYEIKHLAEKTAYDQWHRLLFARYLLENNLLMSPEHGVPVSLADCEDFAGLLNLRDAWAVAARFAARELPEIFRDDDPAGEVELPVEDRNQLVQFVTGLPVEVFTASDSLGWCYQFWQAERKDQVNEAGNKIGADELPAVTQLFTEDYMVDFLLDNTLGAWWAGRCAAVNSHQFSVISCPTEADARRACALPGCEWKYLRFVRVGSDGRPLTPALSPGGGEGEDQSLLTSAATGRWIPAAGTFEGWPKTAKELKCLDPCMGSGHFEVAMFTRLVALRLAEEKLDEVAAVAAVIRDNLFGLEIDPRCTQIAAFNLALAAWRRAGFFKLDKEGLNLACCGLAPNARQEDWLKLPGDNDRLQRGMARLYGLFKDAPVLGSLINPCAGGGDLVEADFSEIQPLLKKALEREAEDDTAHEMAVTARGLAKAAEILAGQFTLVATNVPYLGRGKQDEVLQSYCERIHPDSAADLATCFVERALKFCAEGGSSALVTPQNWLFLKTYKLLRKSLLVDVEWNAVARLGSGAFETIGGEVVNVVLLVHSNASPSGTRELTAIDASAPSNPREKCVVLREGPILHPAQAAQLQNPDSIIQFETVDPEKRVGKFGFVRGGITSGDSPYFRKHFWEVKCTDSRWAFQQGTVDEVAEFGGRELVLLWEDGKGELASRTGGGGATIAGRDAWEKSGVAITYMSGLKVTRYEGQPFENVICVLIPKEARYLSALWAFASSEVFEPAVRSVNQKLSVDVRYFEKAPFDLAHWQKVAAEKYPHGLPKPFSSDPTQWLFNGHPAIIHHRGTESAEKTGTEEENPSTPPSESLWLRNSLQVAVARLLGYRWPRQTGSSFPDCPALGPDGLEDLADDDGIVCLSATKGEAPAAERLRELLARAYGSDWTAQTLEQLLSTLDPRPSSLEDWLRNGFFEQHCALFHHRPFIWHIWDGHKAGFSALVNYHRLDHANLEKLAYAYLGDWIRRQQAAVEAGEAGSDARLQAAKQLQAKLKLILDGDPPHDIFVRWKGLAAQAIGWNPDLNDGVRMNIRPFATADILRKRVKIKWDKDRGKEPQRDKAECPWFWKGAEFTGDRVNDVHLTREQKEKARKATTDEHPAK